MYTINRLFGISSTATGYEYRRVANGEFGETVFKTFIIRSTASMRRIYKLTNGWQSGQSSKQVKMGWTYRRIMKIA